jgi:hypothetical protein
MASWEEWGIEGVCRFGTVCVYIYILTGTLYRLSSCAY